MQLDLSLSALFQHGGVVLAILLLASLWSWIIIVDRWLTFGRAEKGSDRLASRVTKLVRAGQANEARDLAQEEGGCQARVLLTALAHPSREKEVLVEALQRRQAEEVLGLEARLAALGTIGSVSPYIGLFGTVLGVIRSFQSLGQGAADASGAAIVSVGIAEALVATAAGLAVAVPAVIFFNAFSRRLTVLETRMEAGASEIVEALLERQKKGGANDA
ncbi:MAG TPA: MotA/TolQ/ExbB proton channel family protein [bacterium]|jgi:biopolymer transport protein ExbB/TolQ|nr:MotA/TolQ/ExbB proton channel family protein [bacterium]